MTTTSLTINTCILIVIPLLLYLYYTARKKVTCWFCQHVQMVKRNDVGCWTCRSCSQYNGFNETGDYNVVNPALYDERLNPKKFCVTKVHPKEFGNGLCEDCNTKQNMKMKLLNDFSPFDENNFDLEYQEYSKYVDTLYALCKKCDNFAASEIRKKDQKYAKKLRFSTEDEFSDGSSSSSPAGFPKKVILSEFLCVMVSLILLLVDIYDLDQDSNLGLLSLPPVVSKFVKIFFKLRMPITVAGLMSSLSATHYSGIQLLSSSDVVSSFFWMSLQILHMESSSSFFNRHDLFLLRPISCFVNFIFTTNNIMARRKLRQDLHDRVVRSRSRESEEVDTTQPGRSNLRTAVIKPQVSESVDQLVPPINEKIDLLHLNPDFKKTEVKQSQRLSFESIDSKSGRTGDCLALVKPAKFKYTPVEQTSWVGAGLWSKSGQNFKSHEAVGFEASWSGVISRHSKDGKTSEPSGVLLNKFQSLYLPFDQRNMTPAKLNE